MGHMIKVIGCDLLYEEDVHSKEPEDYTLCIDCLNAYNDTDCKTMRNDLELDIVFGQVKKW